MAMKLAAIYNVWADWDLLELSVKNIEPLVDGIIIVASHTSNYGEIWPISERWMNDKMVNIIEPTGAPMTSETAKRNFGIQKARELGFTHFVMMDADEFYDPQEFTEAKESIGDKLGLVCRSKVYFKSPTLTIGYDTTLVPFIHKLTLNIQCAFNRNYPFAWTDEDGKPYTHKKRIRIDPTRSYNISSGVHWSEVTMHHYSWVRSDIGQKIRNSTARMNIERSSIVRDYVNAKPGYYCEFYQKTLIECSNVFGIPAYEDKTVQAT